MNCTPQYRSTRLRPTRDRSIRLNRRVTATTAAAEDEDASDSDEDSDEAEDMVLVDMKDSKFSATTQFVVKDSAGKVG